MSGTTNALRTSRFIPGDETADENQVEEHAGRARKRARNLRKGTHSCWACKRRKEKCTFDNGDVCAGCLRRGTKCVSQQFDDSDVQATAASTTATAAAARLQRIEDMVAKLTTQMQNQSHNQAPRQRPNHSLSQFPGQTHSSPLPTPLTGSSPATNPPATVCQPSPQASTVYSAWPGPPQEAAPVARYARPSSLQTLSRTLHEALPCPQDIQLLRKASARHPVLSTIHITVSYATLRRDGIQPTDGVLREPPPPTAEPVLIAKYLLQLAVFLQEMQPVVYPELRCLAEPVATLTERCATMAINLVTRQDDLLGSVESLESVVLESVYQSNSGNLRLSWMASQRAILLARTMGLDTAGNNHHHRRDTPPSFDSMDTRTELPHVWFRIVHYNLQLSRMLGLTPGAADVTKAALPSRDLAAASPEAYLEQVYGHFAMLALAQRSASTGRPDFETTQALDQDMQSAASAVPDEWWLPPNLTESANNPHRLFWDMRRLMTQMLHHDLRNQMHVPYMLSRGEDHRQQADTARLECVTSSREILSRFIRLRDFNWVASSCRFVNFLGLMAAITLVLAHLGDSRRAHAHSRDKISSQVDSLLSQEALSDRVMMEQALETMRRVGHYNGDALCVQSADVLHRLLDIEARNNFHITQGNTYVSVHAQTDNRPATATAAGIAEKCEGVVIPYFGVMRIVRPENNDATCETATPVTASSDTGTWTESGFSHAPGTADLVDPLLLDLRDENWMSQSIDMTFLDAFLEGST